MIHHFLVVFHIIKHRDLLLDFSELVFQVLHLFLLVLIARFGVQIRDLNA